jgi:hypothetical protein
MRRILANSSLCSFSASAHFGSTVPCPTGLFHRQSGSNAFSSFNCFHGGLCVAGLERRYDFTRGEVFDGEALLCGDEEDGGQVDKPADAEEDIDVENDGDSVNDFLARA